MQKLGGYIIFFAIGSAILAQTNYQFRIMSWMNEMGDGAWAVRGFMVAAGALMIFAGTQQQATSQAKRAQQQYAQQQRSRTQQF